MKKLFLRKLCVMAMLWAGNHSYAQVSAYTFSQSMGTYTQISGGTQLGSGTIDDDEYDGVPIGFNFNFNGTVYTQVSVNTNGFLILGSSGTNSYNAISGGENNEVIAANSQDLQGTAIADLSYELQGTAPNQTFVVQWKGFRHYNTTGDNYNFQIRLNQTTNTIDIVYGTTAQNATDRNAEVGLGSNFGADFNNRTTMSDWSATTAGASNADNCLLSSTPASVVPASGLTFTWTPPSCLNPGLLSATNITGSSADLTWVAGGSESLWDVYFGASPLTAPNGSTTPTFSGVSSTTQAVSLGSPLTSYEFYVRADCGSGVTSNWAGPYTFLSGCPGTGCSYTFNMTDSYGDGWNGNYLTVVVGGVNVADVGLGFTNGYSYSETVNICEGETLELVWHTGGSSSECGMIMEDAFGNSIANFGFGSAPSDGTTFYSGTGNCTAPAIDMKPVTLDSPGLTCYGNNEDVRVVIKNNGANTIDFSVNPVDVDVTVAGPNPMTFTTVTVNSGTLAAGATAVVIIASGYDMSAAGTYTFDATTTVAGDGFTGNDAMPSVDRTTLPAALPVQYTEDFESSTSLPAGYNGSMYVVTGNGNNNSNGLTYDLYYYDTYAEMTLPLIGTLPSSSTLEFDYRAVDYSGYPSTATTLVTGDSLNLKISTDCGNTFSMLYSVNASNHVSTTNFTRPLIDLTPYAGENIMLKWELTTAGTGDFYFDIDNINIREVFPDDAGVALVSNPASGCGLTATENITVSIHNYGSNSLVNPDVSYKINNGTAVTETTALTIAPGASANYTFTATADFSVTGAYSVKAYTALSGDGDLTNDTVVAVINSIITNTLPYFSDFESDNGGLMVGGINSDWEWGTPANQFINAANGCGQNAWVTGLSSNYNTNEVATLTTGCFDFTGSANTPFIRFNNIYNTEAGYDNSWVEYSTDGGSTWTKLDANTLSAGWYNNTSDNVWEGDSPNSNWIISANSLDGLEGTVAMFRFVFNSDVSNEYEGMGIDNLFIGYSFEDAVATAVTAPVTSCGLSSAETITASFANASTVIVPSIDICYTVNGGTPVCETATGPFNPGDIINYTFTATADLSMLTTYDIAIVASTSGDNLICDTLHYSVTNLPTISTYPYLENFENGNGGWTTGGNGNWVLGTPAKANINSAASGVNSWVNGGLTGDYDDNEDSYVISPCFDVSTLPVNPWVALKINWYCEFSWDGAVLQMTKDGGATWANVGNFGAPYQGSPYNWYNDNSIGGDPGGQQLGWTGTGSNSSGGWKIASHPIDTTGFSSVSTIQFRIAFGSDVSGTYEGVAFDDFAVGALPQVDLGVDTSVCGNYLLDPMLDPNGVYNWSVIDTANGNVIASPTSTTVDFNNPATTDTTASITLMYRDTLGLLNYDTVLVTSLVIPNFMLGADTMICVTESVVLNAGTGFSSYNWSDGSSTPTTTADGSVLGAGTYNYACTITSANGCSATDTIQVVVDPCLGINEIGNTAISVYPNPNNGNFLVNFGDMRGNVAIEIFSIDGKLIATHKRTIDNNNTYNLQVAEAVPGIYILKVSGENSSAYQRFIIEK